MLRRFLIPTLFAASFVAAPIRAFGGNKVGALPEMRPLVQQLVHELETELQKSGSTPDAGEVAITRLVGEYSVCSAKERAAIVKVLDRCVEQRRATSGRLQGNPVLALLAAKALGTMGPESVDELGSALADKALRKDKDLARTLALALGHTRDKSGARALKNLLDHPEDALVAAAGEALGEYEVSELNLRKELFEEVLKALMQAKDLKTATAQQAGDSNGVRDDSAEKRYESIEAALCTTLARLSKAEPRGADEWQRWWNKNKRANWDDRSKLVPA